MCQIMFSKSTVKEYLDNLMYRIVREWGDGVGCRVTSSYCNACRIERMYREGSIEVNGVRSIHFYLCIEAIMLTVAHNLWESSTANIFKLGGMKR